MKQYPNRQIHMDFHTSPDIPDIGALFNPDEFGLTLKEAGVQLVNLFGKCHHGYYYYPTKVGMQHPNLNFNLLQAQIDACRKENIEFTVYTCVGWNEYWAKLHPEWLEVSPEGVLGSKKPFERRYYQWNKLCLNNMAYRELLKVELKEMYTFFQPKGFWIDIILQNECLCKTCLEKMKNLGLDPNEKGDRERLSRIAQIDFQRDIYDYINNQLQKELHIYFNGYSYAMDLNDELEISNTQKQKYNTFMDIESLPSDEWGYTHFPISVNYMNKYNKEITMMNGKFHTSWGDFGSLRNKNALEYECFRALAYGAGICVGDQLHPSGKIDKSVYKRIGEVFKAIEEKEPWCLDTTKIAQIGVYGTTKASHNVSSAVDRAAEGAYRVLQELKYQFDYLDLEDDIQGYELLILPDQVTLTQEAALKIDAYVKNGGAVLITGNSALGKDNQFMLETMGVDYISEAEYCPRYMHIDEEFWNIPTMDYVTYEQGVSVKAKASAEVMAYTVNPYFNRSEAHFCSHRQTPPRIKVSDEPTIVKMGKVIYVSNPLFTDFAKNGVKVYKDIIGKIIASLVDRPMIKADLPALTEVIIRKNHHNHESRIMHVLNYIIQRKCQTLDTIEDVIPIYNGSFEVKCESKPTQVRIVPDLKVLEFSYQDGYVKFVVPKLKGHTMIEIMLEK